MCWKYEIVRTYQNSFDKFRYLFIFDDRDNVCEVLGFVLYDQLPLQMSPSNLKPASYSRDLFMGNYIGFTDP